jgi:hypothetical protein
MIRRILRAIIPDADFWLKPKWRTPQALEQSVKYVIEDMRIRASQLEQDRWYSQEDLVRETEKNAFAAAILRQEAKRLEKILNRLQS